MPLQRVSAAVLALVLSGGSLAQTQAEFDLPAPSADGGARMQLWATHYFVHAAASIASGVPFRDKAGAVLSDAVSPRDWCLAAIEGTVQVTHQGAGRTLNYAGTGSKSLLDCAAVLKIDPSKKPWIVSTGKSYFAAAKGPFGDGVAGYKLVPYRTVAVDKSVIPYGKVLFVPSARGVQIDLPSGGTFRHDGYFFAADTGGAIKGNHVDVFCGVSAKNCLPAVIKSDATRTFDAVLVDDEAVAARLRSLHK